MRICDRHKEIMYVSVGVDMANKTSVRHLTTQGSDVSDSRGKFL